MFTDQSFEFNLLQNSRALLILQPSLYPTTLARNIQLLRKQTDFDFTVEQYPVSDENSAG